MILLKLVGAAFVIGLLCKFCFDFGRFTGGIAADHKRRWAEAFERLGLDEDGEP